jgi:uroporphyrinogen III methyltransferase/synthase
VVYLVGAGPGDPRLVTVRGRALLAEADVVVYDRLVHPALLDWIRPEALCLYVGKEPGHAPWPQAAINTRLIEEARRGARVVRLKGGDPFLFGRGGEEAAALAAAGVPFEVVPGVSSAWAVPAAGGIPVTYRGVSRQVVVLAGPRPDGVQVPEPGPVTLVVLMGAGEVERWGARLREAGWPDATPVAAVEWGTWGDQRVVETTLAGLSDRLRDTPLGHPSVIVVGDVVPLGGPIRRGMRGPLAGSRVVGVAVAGELDGLEAWRELGAEVVVVRLVGAAPRPDLDVGMLATWLRSDAPVAFDSAEAVEVVLDAWRAAGQDLRAVAAPLSALSPAAAAALNARGLVAGRDSGGPGRVVFAGPDRGEARPGGWLGEEWIPVVREVRRGLDPLRAFHLFERPATFAVFSSPRAVTLLAAARDPDRWGTLRRARLFGASPATVAALERLGLTAGHWAPSRGPEAGLPAPEGRTTS